jgi:hypothetical protein
MATLVFHLDEGSSMTHSLESGTTTIGRHPDSIIVLDCPSVSGHHAIIEMQDDTCLVIDQQSSNGTRVNSATIEEAHLKDGDRVAFGDIQAVFYQGDAPADGEVEAQAIAAAVPTIFVPAPEIPEDSAPPPRPADYRKVNKPPAKPKAVRRVSGYPDTTESGCLTALIVMILFLVAFAVGLSMRHYKETDGGNFFSDVISKIGKQVPKIKIEQ